MYVKVRDLPSVLQNALASVGYRRADVSIEARETTSLMAHSNDGYRASVLVLNMSTGAQESRRGSWGGANMFNPRNAVDLDDSQHTIPANGAVIHWSEGGSKPVSARIEVSPSTFAPMLPALPTLSTDEWNVLHCFATLKSGPYRTEEFRRRKVTPEMIGDCIARGYLKRTKSGATSLTTEGRNAHAAAPKPADPRLW